MDVIQDFKKRVKLLMASSLLWLIGFEFDGSVLLFTFYALSMYIFLLASNLYFISVGQMSKVFLMLVLTTHLLWLFCVAKISLLLSIILLVLNTLLSYFNLQLDIDITNQFDNKSSPFSYSVIHTWKRALVTAIAAIITSILLL